MMNHDDFLLVGGFDGRFLKEEVWNPGSGSWLEVSLGEPLQVVAPTPVQRCDRSIATREEDGDTTIFLVTQEEDFASEPYTLGPANPGETWRQLAHEAIGVIPGTAATVMPTYHSTDFVISLTVDEERISYLIRVDDSTVTLVETLGAGDWVFFNAALTSGAIIEHETITAVSGRTLGLVSPIPEGAGSLMSWNANRLWFGAQEVILLDPFTGQTWTVDTTRPDLEVPPNSTLPVPSASWNYVAVPDDTHLAVYVWGAWSWEQYMGAPIGDWFRYFRFDLWRYRISSTGGVESVRVREWEYDDFTWGGIPRNVRAEFSATALHAIAGHAAVISELDFDTIQIS